MPRHTARGIVLHKDQLLLIERWRDTLHYFSIPGGGIEPGETPEQTVIREIAEETGCRVLFVRQIYQLQTDDGSIHRIFLCIYQAGMPHLPADSPEARLRDPNNRFEPCWLPAHSLASVQFLVWEPIRKQLLHDIAQGFPEKLVTLTP